jgi:hypothetical protein
MNKISTRELENWLVEFYSWRISEAVAAWMAVIWGDEGWF